MYVHEDYNRFDFSNDICLISLQSLPIDDPSVDDGNRIKPVPLPEQGTQYTSGPAVVSGWGTLESGGSSPDELMAVEVPIVGDEECNVDYDGDIDADSMICAGEAGKDSCQVRLSLCGKHSCVTSTQNEYITQCKISGIILIF